MRQCLCLNSMEIWLRIDAVKIDSEIYTHGKQLPPYKTGFIW